MCYSCGEDALRGSYRLYPGFHFGGISLTQIIYLSGLEHVDLLLCPFEVQCMTISCFGEEGSGGIDPFIPLGYASVYRTFTLVYVDGVVDCRVISVQLAAVCRGTVGHGDDTWLAWTLGLLRDVIV